MNPKELRAMAEAALYKAKALRDEFKAGMPSDKMEEFNAHMAEFGNYSKQYKAALALEEQYAALDQGVEEFTTVDSPLENLDDVAQGQTSRDERSATEARQHREAFARYIAYGDRGISLAEQRKFVGRINVEELAASGAPPETWAHLGTVDSLGGFLVPEEFMGELIKDLAGATVMRRLARVRQTSRSVASFLSLVGSGNRQYTSGLTGSFRSEGWTQNGDAMPVQNQPRFGRERVPVYIWSPDVIEITMELLEDAGLNLEAEIRALLVETRGQDEESVFILGNGSGMPTGIQFDCEAGNVTAVDSGAATAITYDGLVNLWTELPAQYRANATWLMNSASMGQVMLLKDNQDRPLYPVNEPLGNLLGRPVEISEFMPDIAAGVKPIIFGDFNRGYGIADRMDMRIIRLNERYAPNIGIMAVARVGGQMLRAEPFRCQNISA